jgi:hypothetical protein
LAHLLAYEYTTSTHTISYRQEYATMFANTRGTLASPEQSRSRSKSRTRRRELALTRSMQAAAAAAAESVEAAATDEFSVGNTASSSSRRRNMGFMKYAPEQKRSSTSMNRTREHAKQIAMAISHDVAVSASSSSFADFGSAFGSTDDPFADLVVPPAPTPSFRSTKPPPSMFPGNDDANAFATHANDDFFQVDLFSPEAMSKHTQQTQRIPSGGTVRRGKDAPLSLNPGVTDWPVAAAAAAAPAAPVVRVSAVTASPVTIRKTVPSVTMGPMPPSNSTARDSASNTHNNFADFAHADSSAQGKTMRPSTSRSSLSRLDEPSTPERVHHKSVSNSSSSHYAQHATTLSPVPQQQHQHPLSAGAAARRRVRTQMRKREEPNTNTSHGSTSSQVTLSPPYHLKRSDSNGSAGRGKTTNHVANYSVKQPQQSRNMVAAAAAAPLPPNPGGSTSSTSTELNLFDANTKNGFSFDAFGLDSAEMQREVTEAVNALAGSHPGLSMFLQDDDFVAASRWDTNSMNNSLNDSANMSVTSRRRRVCGRISRHQGSRCTTANVSCSRVSHSIRTIQFDERVVGSQCQPSRRQWCVDHEHV